MPVSRATLKVFVRKVYDEGKIDLEDILNIFYSNPKNRKFDVVKRAIDQYISYGEREMSLVDKSTGQSVVFNQDVMGNSENYEVKLTDIRARENVICNNGSYTLNPSSLRFEPISGGPEDIYMVHCGSGLFEMYGDKALCLTQYERLRSYTNMVAQVLLSRNFERFSSLFCEQVSSKYTMEYLSDKFNTFEQRAGGFEFFDRVGVGSVHAGHGLKLKDIGDIKIPKGMKKEQRIGESFFQLNGDHTPNGLSEALNVVRIAVMEASNGCFKIFDIKFMYTA